MSADAPVTQLRSVGDPRTPAVPPHQQVAAETVRRHLVALRGGAPFMSPNDAALLVSWLDVDTPVVHILAALELAADRRRRQRRRVPLALEHAKADLAKATGKGAFRPPLAASPSATGLAVVAAELRGTARDPALRGLGLDVLADQFVVLTAPDPAEAAIALVGAWLTEAWVSLGPEGREPWLSRARAALSDIAHLIDDGDLDQLVDEHARGLLREDLPALSAARILGALSP